MNAAFGLGLPRPAAGPRVAAGFHHGATYYQHRAFLEAIRNPDAPRIDARAGLAATALGLAAQRSIECGTPVALASPPTDGRARP